MIVLVRFLRKGWRFKSCYEPTSVVSEPTLTSNGWLLHNHPDNFTHTTAYKYYVLRLTSHVSRLRFQVLALSSYFLPLYRHPRNLSDSYLLDYFSTPVVSLFLTPAFTLQSLPYNRLRARVFVDAAKPQLLYKIAFSGSQPTDEHTD